LSDSKQYYYLKLKDNYFDQDNIKILESMENGHVYSLIILKMYLKSLKYDGCLMMTHEIPYSPKELTTLAKVINHDPDNVKEAIKLGIKLGLITLLDQKQFWMTNIQNFIGHSSTEADRIRKYRKKLCTNVQELNDKRTPELDLELKKKKELDEKTNVFYCHNCKIDVSIKYGNFGIGRCIICDTELIIPTTESKDNKPEVKS
jgi:predicted phage replisome organizer